MQEYQKGEEEQGPHKRFEKGYLLPGNSNLSINLPAIFFLLIFQGGFD